MCNLVLGKGNSFIYNRVRDLNFDFFDERKFDFYRFTDLRQYNKTLANFFRTDKSKKVNEYNKDNLLILPMENKENKMILKFETFSNDLIDRDWQRNRYKNYIRDLGLDYENLITCRLIFEYEPLDYSQEMIEEVYSVINRINDRQDPEFPNYEVIFGVFHLDSMKNNSHIHLLLGDMSEDKYFLPVKGLKKAYEP